MKISKKIVASCLALSMIITLADGAPTASAASKPKLSQTKLVLKVGQSKKLKVKKSKKKVKWSSNKKKIATVSQKGLVKAKKAGKAVITAKVAGKKLKCKVTVKAKATSTSAKTKAPTAASVRPNQTTAPSTSGQTVTTATPNSGDQTDKTPTPDSGDQTDKTPTPGSGDQTDKTPAPGSGDQTDKTPAPGSGDQPGTDDPEEPKLVLEASKESGTYNSAFQLTLSSEAGATIYYTLDGSDPLTSSTRKTYSGEISITDRKNDANVLSAVPYNKFYTQDMSFKLLKEVPTDVVDKCTVLRAVAEDAEGNQSNVLTNTYFIGNMSEHINGIQDSVQAAGKNLSIISISMDYNDLFDETNGIYVIGKSRNTPNFKKRGKEWERDCHIDYFESDGTKTSLELSQDCGIRIQGNYSREDVQKSFRLYAKEKYGVKNFKYPFFDGLNNADGEPMKKFKTLVLRNGGNDCRDNNYKYKDNIMQSFMHDLECETLHGRPCVVYLDGEYWGYYILQDDVSDNFLQEKRGVVKEDVLLYKGSDEEKYEEYGYKLDEGELPEGVTDESYYLQETLQFMENNDLSNDSKYKEFIDKYMCEDSAVDYYASMLYLNNRYDWPGKNWSIWRTLNNDTEISDYEDGRWRFCIYDLDLTTNTTWGDSEYGVANDKVVSTDSDNPNLADENGYIPQRFFAHMMKNASFRTKLAEKVKKMATELFTASKVEQRGQEYLAIYRPLYEQFRNRFFIQDISATSGDYNHECNIAWLKTRISYVDTLVDKIQNFGSGDSSGDNGDNDYNASFGDTDNILPSKNNTLIWQGIWSRTDSSINKTTARTDGFSLESLNGSFIQLNIDESIWNSYQKPMIALKVADGAGENARCHIWDNVAGGMNTYFYLREEDADPNYTYQIYQWTTQEIDISGLRSNTFCVNANDAQLVEIQIFEGATD